MVHEPSPIPPQTKDFIKINKMALRAGAFSLEKHKEFLKGLDIKKQFKYSQRDRYIDLPPDEFSYGLKNRPSTPIKDVINGGYGNRAAKGIRKKYQVFYEEKSKVKKLFVKRTPHFKKLLESRKLNQQSVEEKPFKMKLFANIPSKLGEDFKRFKSMRKLNKNMSADNIFDWRKPEEIKVNEENKAEEIKPVESVELPKIEKASPEIIRVTKEEGMKEEEKVAIPA